MFQDKKNILIVGRGAVVSALAKKLSKSPECGKIYAAPGGKIQSEHFESVDIREDDTTGLLKFALENKIFLTVPVSARALKSDIASFFQENRQNIFGPVLNACKIAVNNVYGKKFLYKIHAKTPKFAVFDKLQQAQDYLKTANFPLLIRCSQCTDVQDMRVCPVISQAQRFLNTLFAENETNVLIEEYTYGASFTVYYITDGYSAVPITSVRNYKFTQDGNGGILTDGTGCFAPDYNVSGVLLSRVENIVRNTLAVLAKKGNPYVGILGIDCTMTGEDKFYVNEFKPFLRDCDAAAVLNLIEEDLFEVFRACVDGIFADDWQTVKTNNLSSVSAVVMSRLAGKPITGLDKIGDIENIDFISAQKTDDDIYLTQNGAVFVLTRSAGLLSRARKYLYEDIGMIKFDSMKFRKDIICTNIY